MIEPGQKIRQFRVEAFLGAGGMGEVYRAFDEVLERPVALKVIHAAKQMSPEARARFLREARILSKLDHPNICRVYDLVLSEEQQVLVLELIEGRSLGRAIVDGLDDDGKLAIAEQIAQALEAAHRARVIHRDLKPENVMIGGDGSVKVLDFGLARSLRRSEGAVPSPRAEPTSDPASSDSLDAAELSRQGVLTGTIRYMSPEQARGEALSEATDLYSYGILLQELLTESPAYGGGSFVTVVRRVQRAETDPLSGVDPGLLRLLEELLALDPARRPSAADSAARLRAVRERPQRRRARRRLVLAAALAPLALVAGLWLSPLLDRDERPLDPRRIAVLPLTNADPDPDEEYFSDGMTEELITALSRSRELRVIARASIMRYKGRDEAPTTVGQELGAGTVVTGRVRQHDDRVRVMVEAVDAAAGEQIWARTYERPLAEIFAIQQDIAEQLAQHLELQLVPGQGLQRPRPPTADPEAYKEVLKGLYHWNRRTAEGFQRALEHYRMALSRDPRLALAHAGIADTFNLLGNYGFAPPREVFPRAIDAAERALALEPDLAQAHSALGLALLFFQWDWSLAEEHLSKAIELNPGYATGHQMYAHWLMIQGRLEEALAEIRFAHDLDPLSPIITTDLGMVLFVAGRRREAIEQCRSALELEPSFPLAHIWLGEIHLADGRPREAVDSFRRAAETLGGHPFAASRVAVAEARAGRRDEAARIAGELRERAERQYVSAHHLAKVALALGDSQAALQWLEQALEERSPFLVFNHLSPSMQPLLEEPRYRDLQRQLGLPLTL